MKMFLSVSFICSNCGDTLMILANSSCLFLVYDLQPTKKCASSSMIPHNEQSLPFKGVLGLVYLPLSTSRVCQLALSFVIAFIYS